MCSFFFTETWRITCKCLWKLILCQHCIDEFTNHGMLTCTDQIQVFTLYFVHHGIHLCKAHNSCYYITSDHKWRNAVSKSSVDHEISCIRNNCRVKSCNISHKVIESISGYFSGTFKVDSIKAFHNICMIWNFVIRYDRLTEFFNFNVLAVVFSNWYRRIDNIWNNHHILFDFSFYFFFFFR